MLSLTTAQRDLLYLLLTTETPIGAAALGQSLHLTPRQVSYSLRSIKLWLARRHASLRQVPGVGIQLICSAQQRERLYAELESHAKFQLILTPEQRGQLLALVLLITPEPLTLNQLQQDLAVARTTVLKDLDVMEIWLASFGLQVVRRQHRGCWIEGAELAKRQALAALLWGDVPFSLPIISVQAGLGFDFVLQQDAVLLPIIQRVNSFLQELDLPKAQQQVIWAEAALNARFSDQAISLLALALALQQQRINAQQYLHWHPETLHWLEQQLVWPVAKQFEQHYGLQASATIDRAEIAGVALQLVCAARERPWPNQHETDHVTVRLINALIDVIATSYDVAELANDRLLGDGLAALIPPACNRQRFGLWIPTHQSSETQSERYATERRVADLIDRKLLATIGVALPIDARDELILLLRAAVVRARPVQTRNILVVCPSGMATTQLLVARLKARFPKLGIFEVLSMRELSAERLANADLVITTAPLALASVPIDVIQVHPMLHPEDIAALTQWMV